WSLVGGCYGDPAMDWRIRRVPTDRSFAHWAVPSIRAPDLEGWDSNTVRPEGLMPPCTTSRPHRPPCRLARASAPIFRTTTPVVRPTCSRSLRIQTTADAILPPPPCGETVPL